ncbi:hypothetical protein Taro_046359 [Colocasia esculenta]|uniref:Uncharacterized protein n=1 Tax=Colocasia esculenta TaxID=4460 RepID=A0A843X614_COLES|nr:hypothetical protein [Colocasia esculenta]
MRFGHHRCRVVVCGIGRSVLTLLVVPYCWDVCCVGCVCGLLSVSCCALCSAWSALLLGLRRCSVCRIASLVEHCDTYLWLLSAWCWLVVSSSEVLPESFSIGFGGCEDCSVFVSAVVVLPQGLRYAVVLAGAFWRVFPEWCLGGSGGGSPRTCLRCFCSSACCGVLSEGLCRLVIWVVRSCEGSSKDRPLSFLADVLPRSALCSFRATVVLLLWFEVCRLVGLRSGEVLPGCLLAHLVVVLPKAARC